MAAWVEPPTSDAGSLDRTAPAFPMVRSVVAWVGAAPGGPNECGVWNERYSYERPVACAVSTPSTTRSDKPSGKGGAMKRLQLISFTVLGLLVPTLSVAVAAEGNVGDPQLMTDHPFWRGELSCSTFQRLFADPGRSLLPHDRPRGG